MGRSPVAAMSVQSPEARTRKLRKKKRLNMVREGEVGLGVFIADVSNQGIKEVPVVRDLAIFNIGGDQIAKETAEVLMPGIGQERARIG